MHSWINVAHLAKTRNVNGRFVARAAAGLPFLLEAGDEVAFVPPQLDVPRRAVVADVRRIDERSADIAFEGVDGAAASVLVGSHCLVPRDLVEAAIFEDAPGAWEGWTVVDLVHGAIGCVVGVIDNPGQALLEVEGPHGNSMLVPIVDEIVVGIDAGEGVVTIDAPRGLLDL